MIAPTTCGLLAECGRPARHRGRHGGFLPVFSAEQSSAMTEAEMRVITMIAQGYQWAEIGQALHIARNTIANHRRHVVAKYPPAQTMIDVLRAIGWLRVPPMEVR